jgi:hypothetical protein
VVELRRWRFWLRAGPCAGGRRGAVGRRSSPVDGGHDGGALAASVSLLGASWRGTALLLQGAQGESLVLRDVRRWRLGVVFWSPVASGVELAGGAAGGALVRVVVWALRAHGLWMA